MRATSHTDTPTIASSASAPATIIAKSRRTKELSDKESLLHCGRLPAAEPAFAFPRLWCGRAWLRSETPPPWPPGLDEFHGYRRGTVDFTGDLGAQLAQDLVLGRKLGLHHALGGLHVAASYRLDRPARSSARASSTRSPPKSCSARARSSRNRSIVASSHA